MDNNYDLLNIFISDIEKLRGLQNATLINYRYQLTRLFKHCDKPVEQITRSDLASYFNLLRETNLLDSIDGYKLMFNIFFEWYYLSFEKEYTKNPMFTEKTKKKSNRKNSELKLIDPNNLKNIIEHGYQLANNPCTQTNSADLQNLLIIQFITCYAPRPKELVSLKETNIDLNKNTIELGRFGSQYRKLPLFDGHLRTLFKNWLILRAALDLQHGYVFVNSEDLTPFTSSDQTKFLKEITQDPKATSTNLRTTLLVIAASKWNKNIFRYFYGYREITQLDRYYNLARRLKNEIGGFLNELNGYHASL